MTYTQIIMLIDFHHKSFPSWAFLVLCTDLWCLIVLCIRNVYVCRYICYLLPFAFFCVVLYIFIFNRITFSIYKHIYNCVCRMYGWWWWWCKHKYVYVICTENERHKRTSKWEHLIRFHIFFVVVLINGWTCFNIYFF